MFSLSVICYLFLGGCGAGVLLIASVTGYSKLFLQTKRLEAERAIENLQARAYVVAVLTIAFSSLFLLTDLGRPERMLLLFTSQTRTWITFGSWTIVGALCVGILMSLSMNTGFPRLPQRALILLNVLASVVALALMTYTGIFLFQMGGQVSFWNSWLLVVLFVLSAISCGFAVDYLLFPFVPNHELVHYQSVISHRIHLCIVAIEAVVLASFVYLASQNARASASVDLLFQSDLSTWFIFGTLFCGIALPLLAGIYAEVFREGHLPLVVEVAALVGAFTLRYCLVMAGLH